MSSVSNYSVQRTINERLADGHLSYDDLLAIFQAADADGKIDDREKVAITSLLRNYWSLLSKDAKDLANYRKAEFYAPLDASAGSIERTDLEIDGEPVQCFTTSGGYVIVIGPEDDHIRIFPPGTSTDQIQSGDAEALTTIWGDPHTWESDGTKWDFTKDGQFVLPDGTVLDMKTTGDEGQTFVENLRIVSGDQMVEIRDLHDLKSGTVEGEPWIGEVTGGGQQWLLDNPIDHRYHLFLSPDGRTVDWYFEENGRIRGRIIGSHTEDDSYVVDTEALADVGTSGVTIKSALALIADYFQLIDEADGNIDGRITLVGLAAIVNDPNAPPELRATARHLLDNPGLLRSALEDGALTQEEARLLNGMFTGDAGSNEYGKRSRSESDWLMSEMNNILSDPGLTVEDKVTMFLFLVMKEMDKQIERQMKHIAELQQQQNSEQARRQQQQNADTWEAEFEREQSQLEAANGGRTSSESIDVETLHLKRLVDKRSQMFDMLRQIIDRYNQTAKGIIDTIGR